MMNLINDKYPISPFLNDICETIKKSKSRFAVMTAETAAGKSTILPLSLLENFNGKILMTEPRRLAVIGVADRVSELIGEETGDTVGYKIHLENKITENTRLEVVTEAILVRMLQCDPVLEGYNLIVLDEFHERSINLDLSLAFLKEAMILRDDLFVLIMSATIDTEKIRSYLDSNKDNVPLIEIPGRQFNVDVCYDNQNSVETVILNELKSNLDGNILVFFPGISEINKCKNNLEQFNLSDDIDICVLHSSIKVEDQKRVISRNGRKRKIILSSAIGETSLTVPGVTCVIDTGFSRINRMNVSCGMENLCTERISEFSAKQRCGRAGREQDGKCIRLWDKNDVLQKEVVPEILRADLTNVILECAERGVYANDGIDWLDSPSKNSWNASVDLLKKLNLIKNDNHITNKGRLVLRIGVNPRLACIAITDFLENGFISDYGKKMLLRFGSYNNTSQNVKEIYLKDIERRLKNNIGHFNIEKEWKIPLVLSGYPDRLAILVEENKESIKYQFPSGRKAVLYRDKIIDNKVNKWIVVPEILAGDIEAKIFDYENIEETDLSLFFENHTEEKISCWFENGKVCKSKSVCYGNIVISSNRIKADLEDYSAAWVSEIKKNGFEVLPINPKIESLLNRCEFLNQEYGLIYDKLLYKSVKEYLVEKTDEWLIPFMNSTEKLQENVIYDALYWFLKGADIDREVPEKIELPNGKSCKVKYEKIDEIKPVVEIIIQRIFGCFETPKICGKKILFRLLSPGSRPLQVTDDLEGFWNGAWPEICKEMKGRYPKHNWNYKITDNSD